MAQTDGARAAINSVDVTGIRQPGPAPMSTKSGSHSLVDPSDEPRSERVARRLRTVPTVVALFLVVTLLAPVILGLTVIADLMRRRHDWTLTRLAVFGWVFLASETVGLIALGAAWLAGGRRTVELTWAFQRWWSSTLFKTLRSVFRLRFVVEGDDQVAPGPVIVMMRHASIVDNLLPAGLVSLPHRHPVALRAQEGASLGPRPGHRGSTAPQRVRAPRSRLGDRDRSHPPAGDGLTERDGVLIYPEGTRFTAKEARSGDPTIGTNRSRVGRQGEAAPPATATTTGWLHVLARLGRRCGGMRSSRLGRTGPGERCAARRVGGEDNPRRLPQDRSGSDPL